HSDVEPAASNECNQRRRVHGSDSNRSGNPAPAAAHKRPAAIVERSKAPRLVVNPGPSPGGHIYPVPVTVRCPASRNTHGRPDVPLIPFFVPASVFIEIFVTVHICGDVLGAANATLALIAAAAPGVESIFLADARHVIGELIGTCKRSL